MAALTTSHLPPIPRSLIFSTCPLTHLLFDCGTYMIHVSCYQKTQNPISQAEALGPWLPADANNGDSVEHRRGHQGMASIARAQTCVGIFCRWKKFVGCECSGRSQYSTILPIFRAQISRQFHALGLRRWFRTIYLYSHGRRWIDQRPKFSKDYVGSFRLCYSRTNSLTAGRTVTIRATDDVLVAVQVGEDV